MRYKITLIPHRNPRALARRMNAILSFLLGREPRPLGRGAPLNSLIFLFLTILPLPGFAEIEKIQFENLHTLRLDVRRDDFDLYLTRALALMNYKVAHLGRSIKISPFFEYQHNLDIDNWWRKELGAEIGTSFFSDYFYIGASFQHIWQKSENYPIELLDETTEWESRFVFTFPVFRKIFKDRLKLKFFDEYTYDFTRGQATFNEVGAVFDWQILEKLRLPIGWRHIDRVHDFDSDYIEISVLFSF